MRKLILTLAASLILTSTACAQTPEPKPASAECVAAGCSGQLCVDSDKAENTISTCEWRRSYSCYKKFSVCERGSDGQCGWRKTPELESCLNQ